MRPSLQSRFRCLERVPDKMDKEMLEMRTRVTELLVTSQSEITMGDQGTLDNGVDFAIIDDSEPLSILPLALDELNAVSPSLTPPDLSISAESLVFQGRLSDPEYGALGLASAFPPKGLPIDKFPQGKLQYAHLYL